MIAPTADDLRMSRARLYVLIDSCEHDMRRMIETYLLNEHDEARVFTEQELDILTRRRTLDSVASESLVHYLDLQNTYDVLLRHKVLLPSELSDELARNASEFAQLVPVRHRVMHGRPLQSEDARLTVTLLGPFQSRYWTETRSAVTRLQRDPTWEPFFEREGSQDERILHNLPEVDYDETTLIGRVDEKKRLLDALKRRRHSVITVTGEGGIGKTALALDVAYQLLDSEDNPYEAILWVSLKTERLTAFGVEELKGAIRGIDETTAAIGQGIAGDFKGGLHDLAAALEDIEALIIVDNLESAQGTEIVEMYDLLPTSVNYLFTSRWGVGQLERIFPLPPLSEAEAILLLRRFSSVRRQSRLASLKQDTAANVVRELRYSPLAIRWFVLASEAGRVPLDSLRNQRELLDFCVKNVVENLSDDSRAVLSVLRALDRPIGFDEFAILTDMTADTLRKVTQELTRGSLVVVEAETAGAIAGRLALTPTAVSFLPRPDHTGSFIAEVLQRERRFRASMEDAFATGDRTRLLLDRVEPRDSSDHSAMYLLQTAQKLAKSGQFEKAHLSIERARSFNPEYSEVYRLSGLVHAMEEHNETAVSQLQTALTYAVGNETIARTCYSLADIIGRRLHDARLAVPYARQAYASYQSGDTAFLLGRLLIWTDEFKEGQEYIEDALDTASGRHRIIVTAALVDSWARWAGAEYRERKGYDAFQKGAAGFHTGLPVAAANPGDGRFIDAVAECAIVLLRAYAQAGPQVVGRQEPMISSVCKFVRDHGAAMSGRKKKYLGEALRSARACFDANDSLGMSLEREGDLLSAGDQS
jgi:LuxR family glucitol operon transcriptional activator